MLMKETQAVVFKLLMVILNEMTPYLSQSGYTTSTFYHDGVKTWKIFLHYWPFAWGTQQWLVGPWQKRHVI